MAGEQISGLQQHSFGFLCMQSLCCESSPSEKKGKGPSEFFFWKFLCCSEIQSFHSSILINIFSTIIEMLTVCIHDRKEAGFIGLHPSPLLRISFQQYFFLMVGHGTRTSEVSLASPLQSVVISQTENAM